MTVLRFPSTSSDSSKGFRSLVTLMFDAYTNDEKEMILARIIERTTVDKDYHITITFFVSYEDFMKGTEHSKEDIRIEESTHIYQTLAC